MTWLHIGVQKVNPGHGLSKLVQSKLMDFWWSIISTSSPLTQECLPMFEYLDSG